MSKRASKAEHQPLSLAACAWSSRDTDRALEFYKSTKYP